MSRRVSTVAFWVAVAALAVAGVLVLWHSVVLFRLWEDEAFNLTVPRNLLDGLGYASDGTLSGSTLTPFDPRISTGPVVLLPIAAVLATGADLVVGARLVPAAFFLALIAAVAVLGHRIGGRWAALVAAAVPLAFTASALPSPIQGPADVLGEVPAAALLAWALVALRRRPWLAGLLAGLAIQAKYISLLALPALVVGLLVLTIGMPWARRIRSLLIAAAFVAVPTAIVELFALVSLGPAGFVQHLRDTVHFIRSGGQVADTTVVQKLTTLLSSWYLPAALIAVVVVAAVAVIAVALVMRTRGASAGAWRALVRDPRAHTVVAAFVGFATFVGWWATASHLPLWVRHPAPGILAFTPVLVATLVPAARSLWRARGAARLLAPATATALVVVLGMQAVLAVTGAFAWPGTVGSLQTQRDEAAAIAEVDADWIATVWGSGISLVVLSGAHVGLLDAPPENIARYTRMNFAHVGECEEPPAVEVGGFAICSGE